MITEFFQKVVKLQKRYPLLIFVIFMTITAFFATHAIHLKTDASFDSLFRDDSKIIERKNLMSSEFGSTETLFAYIQIDHGSTANNAVEDIRDPRVFEALERVQDTIESASVISGTYSASDIIRSAYGRLPETLEESKMMTSNLEDSLKSMMALEDLDAANILVFTNIETDPDAVKNLQKEVEDLLADVSLPQGTEVKLTGFVILLNRIINYLVNDNIFTIFMATVFIFFVLIWFFKSWKYGVMAILPTVMSITWLAGSAVLLDIRLNMMTAALGTMLVGISVDYTIHLIHNFRECMRECDDKPLQRSFEQVSGALFASVMTTAFGFVAMLFADQPTPKLQGVLLIMGITYAFINTVFFAPVVLRFFQVYARDEIEILKEKRKTSFQKYFKIIFTKLAHYQTYRPGLILLIFLGVTLLLFPGIRLLRFDADNTNWIPDDDPKVEEFGKAAVSFGNNDRTNIVFKPKDVLKITDGSEEAYIKDMRDYRILKKMDQIDEYFSKDVQVDSFDSPHQIIKRMNGGTIPRDNQKIRDMVDSNEMVSSYFNDDYSMVRMTLVHQLYDEGNDNQIRSEYNEVIDSIQTLNDLPGIEIIDQGQILQFLEMENSMQKDLGKTTLLGFIFMFFVAAFLYSSFIIGSVALIPILFVVIWTISIMGYIDLPFTVLTSGMLSLVIGLGIDYSIHIIHNIKIRLGQKKSFENAVTEALTSTGEAIFVSTLTTIIGFLSLTLATLLATQRLGGTLALAIACCFISCIIVVPCLISLEQKWKKEKFKIKEIS